MTRTPSLSIVSLIQTRTPPDRVYNGAMGPQQSSLPSLDFVQPRPQARISTHQDGSFEAEVDREHLIPLCEGHFPGLPLVPGAHVLAIMCDLVVRCAEPSSVGATFIPSACVFREPCRPDAALRLALTFSGDTAVVTALQSTENWIARGRMTRRARRALSCEPGDMTLQSLGNERELQAADAERRARVLRLKHRGRALLIESDLGDDEAGRAVCVSVCPRDWHWPLLVDGAAQAAGLAAKRALGDSESTLVVVAYDRIELGHPARDAPILFRTRTVRRVRGMLQQEVEAFQRVGASIQKVAQLVVALAPLPSGAD